MKTKGIVPPHDETLENALLAGIINFQMNIKKLRHIFQVDMYFIKQELKSYGN